MERTLAAFSMPEQYVLCYRRKLLDRLKFLDWRLNPNIADHDDITGVSEGRVVKHLRDSGAWLVLNEYPTQAQAIAGFQLRPEFERIEAMYGYHLQCGAHAMFTFYTRDRGYRRTLDRYESELAARDRNGTNGRAKIDAELWHRIAESLAPGHNAIMCLLLGVHVSAPYDISDRKRINAMIARRFGCTEANAAGRKHRAICSFIQSALGAPEVVKAFRRQDATELHEIMTQYYAQGRSIDDIAEFRKLPPKGVRLKLRRGVAIIWESLCE
jgi:hypothetical protein